MAAGAPFYMYEMVPTFFTKYEDLMKKTCFGDVTTEINPRLGLLGARAPCVGTLAYRFGNVSRGWGY